jgi:Family of unknown function (DUF6502)
MSASRRVRRTGLLPGGVEYERECLSRVARILVHSGHSPKRLWRDFRDICSNLKEPTQGWDPNRLAYYTDLAHLMAHWHSDPLYLNSKGLPVAVPLRGRGPSLSALVARVFSGEDPASVAESLVHAKGVRRIKGRYLPIQRSLVLSKVGARIHGADAFLGMLRTVDHNLAGKGRRIFQRAALNPSIPASALPAFNAWVEKFGERFLHGADNFLHNREAEKKGGPRVRVGVGVFVYTGPSGSGVRPRRKPPRARGSKKPRRGGG